MKPGKNKPIITTPLEFSAAQLWEKIKANLSDRRQLFEYDQLDEDVQVEVDYDIGKIICEHLQAVREETP